MSNGPGFFDNLFAKVFHESKQALKDYVKSQIILSAITLAGMLIGLYLLHIKYWILISIVITIVDLLPVVGISVCMIPWAAYEIFFLKNTQLGLWLFLLYVIIMVIRQILEPFVRGKSLGISPWEEVVSSVVGYVVFGMNGLGLIIGPVLYITGKKVYRTFKPAQVEGTARPAFFNRGFQKPKQDIDDPNIIDITDDVEDVEG